MQVGLQPTAGFDLIGDTLPAIWEIAPSRCWVARGPVDPIQSGIASPGLDGGAQKGLPPGLSRLSRGCYNGALVQHLIASDT